MQRQATQGGGGGMDEMEMMIDMFVETAKLDDTLFVKEGVTNDDLEDAIMGFMQSGDAEVQKAMMKFTLEMQKEM